MCSEIGHLCICERAKCAVRVCVYVCVEDQVSTKFQYGDDFGLGCQCFSQNFILGREKNHLKQDVDKITGH